MADDTQAPDVQMTPGPAPNVGQDPVQQPTLAPQGGSRLGTILTAVAHAIPTALASIPDKGAPSFITGLGQGARGAQAAQAQQQDVKFKTFDDQMRAAQLHNQMLTLANQTQEQNDAHEDHMAKMHAGDKDWGIEYDTIANHGDAVMDHLKTQTAANGAASVPPGTHVSPDGQNILIPKDTPDSNAGQLSQFKAIAPSLGLNVNVPAGATKLDPRVATAFYNKLQGFDANGDVYTADKLPALIASNQAQRDSLAKNGAPQAQLDALDGIVGKQKAQLKADNDAMDASTQRKTDADAQLIQAKGDQARKTQAEKPQKTTDVDGNGNPLWRPNVTSDEKKKTELAENMTFNANNIASILSKRPDLVGKVSGRITSVEQLAGTNDPDLVQLGTDIHNIAMANNGIHGMRSNEGVHDFESKLLNSFKNGPQGIAGGLRGSVNSVQTFIDNARPDTYKTHSKNGGAIRGMMPDTGKQ